MEGAYLFALLTVRINTHHEKYRAFTFNPDFPIGS